MDWFQAKSKIESLVKIGVDLNTSRSTYRFVKATDTVINSSRYGYKGEKGFVVSIGKSVDIKVPWSILKKCFSAIKSPDGYNGNFFREHFPLQAKDHGCHVHVIGQIFVNSGIAETDGKKYVIHQMLKTGQGK